jgi:penicillin-binding protein 1A
MGYTPQLLAGTWVGCDDRFIQIENGAYMGGTAARPIWEAFFKKVYADKSLGIDKDAAFLKPADLDNEANSADSFWYNDPSMDDSQDNNANEGEYSIDTSTYIPPESQNPTDDDVPKRDQKKDTSKAPRIGEMKPQDDKKEKKNIFKKIFGGKKDKDDPENDY